MDYCNVKNYEVRTWIYEEESLFDYEILYMFDTLLDRKVWKTTRALAVTVVPQA